MRQPHISFGVVFYKVVHLDEFTKIFLLTEWGTRFCLKFPYEFHKLMDLTTAAVQPGK